MCVEWAWCAESLAADPADMWLFTWLKEINSSIHHVMQICLINNWGSEPETHRCVFACVVSADSVDRKLSHILHTAEGFVLHAALAVSAVPQLSCPLNHQNCCYLTTCKSRQKSIFVRLRCWLAMKSVEWCQRRVTWTDPKENLRKIVSWWKCSAIKSIKKIEQISAVKTAGIANPKWKIAIKRKVSQVIYQIQLIRFRFALQLGRNWIRKYCNF